MDLPGDDLTADYTEGTEKSFMASNVGKREPIKEQHGWHGKHGPHRQNHSHFRLLPNSPL